MAKILAVGSQWTPPTTITTTTATKKGYSSSATPTKGNLQAIGLPLKLADRTVQHRTKQQYYSLSALLLCTSATEK